MEDVEDTECGKKIVSAKLASVQEICLVEDCKNAFQREGKKRERERMCIRNYDVLGVSILLCM